MPGVQALLPRQIDAGVLLGIVSGALEAGARIKLARGELNHYFAFGGYGSDSADRGDLTQIAIDRSGRICGHPLDPTRILVVGDTRRDVKAAHAAGAVAVVVATGKYTLDELRAAGADHALPTLDSPLPGIPAAARSEEVAV